MKQNKDIAQISNWNAALLIGRCGSKIQAELGAEIENIWWTESFDRTQTSKFYKN